MNGGKLASRRSVNIGRSVEVLSDSVMGWTWRIHRD